jgi:hypothetical protein
MKRGQISLKKRIPCIRTPFQTLGEPVKLGDCNFCIKLDVIFQLMIDGIVELPTWESRLVRGRGLKKNRGFSFGYTLIDIKIIYFM